MNPLCKIFVNGGQHVGDVTNKGKINLGSILSTNENYVDLWIAYYPEYRDNSSPLAGNKYQIYMEELSDTGLVLKKDHAHIKHGSPFIYSYEGLYDEGNVFALVMGGAKQAGECQLHVKFLRGPVEFEFDISCQIR